MDITDISKCEKCGHDSYYIFDKRELREENICLNEDCGLFTIDFEKSSDFDPNSVNENYSKFLNSLESDEDDEMKYYWGVSSPERIREFIQENL
jgi:hypothetical protein